VPAEQLRAQDNIVAEIIAILVESAKRSLRILRIAFVRLNPLSAGGWEEGKGEGAAGEAGKEGKTAERYLPGYKFFFWTIRRVIFFKVSKAL
jgi:hypothetical protein